MADAVTTTTRSLATIAAEIRADWTNPYFGAVPYIAALAELDKVTDTLPPAHQENGAYIINYFLTNARTWKGETAKRVKAELKTMLKR